MILRAQRSVVRQQTRNEVRVDDEMKKRSAVHFTPRKISPNYPQLFFSTCETQSIFSGFSFERLSDGWFWFIVANYLTSFLSGSAKKKRGKSLSHWLPFDVGVFVASCSLSIYDSMQCFYITKDTLFSHFLTADCLFVCTFSHLLWLNVNRNGKGSWRKAINIHMKCALKSSRKKKPSKKSFRISLKHSNIHLTLRFVFFFFWQIFDFFCAYRYCSLQPQMPPR